MSFYPITVNTEPEAEAHIFAEDDAAIYQSIFGGDCVFDIGGKLKFTIISNNKIRIGDGVLCVGGHIGRNKYGDYEDLDIDNGVSGKNRNDLIVARFATTGTGGIDTFTLNVKKGTAGTTAVDPTITEGNLYEGERLREFPIYRVRIEGLSITAVEQLFVIRKTNEQLQSDIDEINNDLNKVTTGVKGNAEKSYRTGNVNLTPENIGAVGIANIINNLLTTAAGYVLDARQGKALDDKIIALNNILNVKQNSLALGNNTITNIDRFFIGCTWFNSELVSGTLPFSNYGFIIAFQSGVNNYVQIAIPYGADMTVCPSFRTHVNGKWQNWRSFYTNPVIRVFRNTTPEESLSIPYAQFSHGVVFAGTTVYTLWVLGTTEYYASKLYGSNALPSFSISSGVVTVTPPEGSRQRITYIGT